MTIRCLFFCLCIATSPIAAAAQSPRSFSGIYPHLAYFNDEGECGSGAVVPWADRLWVVTYGPHFPLGSSDKLYEITSDLRMTIRPESVGGTPANRMVHAESKQLFIGPYVIDENRNVRVIPPSVMPGRLTGNARHLSDPANKIYFATMEEGFYEVDVKSLAVRELYPDANASGSRDSALLPGCHGKGSYSGQGRLVYSNNGESSKEARVRPDIDAGALAEWNGKEWSVIRRNQFTEVTGPGGIRGNATPQIDTLWSIGWDHRSLILMLLDGGTWHMYRLPKASHAYDGAHGWNTEWPRIRAISDDPRQPLLMTMHGMFWNFPRTFFASNSAGITPRSTYLKVIGDFCRWGDRIVLGCDDTAKNEFLNKRTAKGNVAAPGQSQSNLWFVTPATLDQLGPPIGRGAVWLDEPVHGGVASEPYLFDGFDRRGVHFAQAAKQAVTFRFEIDRDGNGEWTPRRSVEVPAGGNRWVEFDPSEKGAWIRVTLDRDCPRETAFFHYASADNRPTDADDPFRSLVRDRDDAAHASGGLLRARGGNRRTLQVAAVRPGDADGDAHPIGSYELDADMALRPMNDADMDGWQRRSVAVPARVIEVGASSVLYMDDANRRWRLPKSPRFSAGKLPFGPERVDREVVTERDLFNAAGIFYELPAENAGGFSKIRPIATHNRHIHDYCSWRGLLVMSGIADERSGDDPHVIRSQDGRCAVWVGAVDDLWKLGKPVGVGGPWLKTLVKTDEPSDPYLMTGFDSKVLSLSHGGDAAINIRVEVDINGNGQWLPYRTFDVPAGETITHAFPRAFQAYWLRVVSDTDTMATAQLRYE